MEIKNYFIYKKFINELLANQNMTSSPYLEDIYVAQKYTAEQNLPLHVFYLLSNFQSHNQPLFNGWLCDSTDLRPVIHCSIVGFKFPNSFLIESSSTLKSSLRLTRE